MSVSIVVVTPAMAQSPKMAVIKTPHQAKIYAKAQLSAWGWNKSQWVCLHKLWQHESNWNSKSWNKQAVSQIRGGKRVRLHAGGIPQILGLNPRLGVPEQVNRGFIYIEARYSTPCQAWAFWARHKWY